MKQKQTWIRYCLLSVVYGLLSVGSAFAFTDIFPHQKIYTPVQHFVDEGVLSGNGYFRAEEDMPRGLFWTILMSQEGIDQDSAVDKVPVNIAPGDPLAPYLSHAIAKGWLSEGVFDTDGTISQGVALKLILEIRGIELPRRASADIRKQVTGLPRRSTSYLRAVEAAYASGIISKGDLRPFYPHKSLSRKKGITWAYESGTPGSKRQSTIQPNREQKKNPNRRLFNVRPSSRKTIGDTNAAKKRTQLKLTINPSRQSIVIPDGEILGHVHQSVMRNYRFADDLDEAKFEAMMGAAIKAYVQAIGDKFTTYIEPSKAKAFTDGLNSNFEGIGAFVDMIKDQFTILSPITGSPAEQAGLLPGDIVTEVDDVLIKGKTVEEIIKLVKGPSGTKVKLKILRGEPLAQQAREITVTRGKITVPSLKHEQKNYKGRDYAYIGIHQFNRTTGPKLKALLEDTVLPLSPEGLVIDLRNNPGGYLTSAVAVGELFLAKGQEVFTVEYRSGNQVYNASSNGILKDFENIVVLTNKGSASASEIVMGMLQDYGKATIMGSSSLGKGSVQHVETLPNGGVLKLTIAKWLTPKGRWINDVGVKPDIEAVDQTVEQRRNKIDPVLDAALDHLFRNGS